MFAQQRQQQQRQQQQQSPAESKMNSHGNVEAGQGKAYCQNI